jgi:8-oxo-dGTP pyrophosphatase MutT (NUDIX family)
MSMRQRVAHVGLQALGRLPGWVKRWGVHVVAPSYSVGAICIVVRDDGARLLIRHSYRGGWSAPGGLLKRGEDPAAAARRETREETGVEVVLDGPPRVFVDPGPRRVDVIFRGHPADPNKVETSTASPEIEEARWFGPDEPLPDLQKETARAMREIGG